MKYIALSSLLIINMGVAFSAEVPKAQIKSITPYDTHINIIMDTPALDPEHCGRGDIFRIAYDTTSSAKLSVFLAAYMAKKPVAMYIEGCLYDTPKIAGVTIGE